MPASPSLLIVPARFKTGKLYTQIATTSAGLVLGSSGDFNVTRATTATRFNSAGLIESVASGVPRLDYYTSGGTAGCPALLVEPTGSNLVVQSQDFSATWAVAASATVTGITSPDGTPNATTFIADSNTDRIRQTITLTSGTTYTYSLFGKFGALSSGFTMNVFQENATTYGSGVCQAFNLNEGTLGASGTVGAGFTLQSVGMENYGNGWYRCRMTVLMGYTPATNPRVGFRIGTQISGGIPLSVVSGSVSAWGAQLETGSVATSYIPTTTASATRNADVINLSGAVSGCIGQTEGTLYAEVDLRNFQVNGRFLAISDGSTTNRITMLVTTLSRINVIVTQGGASQVNIITSTLSAGVYKVAFAYAANDFVLYVNGTQIGTDTSGVVPACANLNLGKVESSSAGGELNDRIRAAALYTTRLTDAQLAALTT